MIRKLINLEKLSSYSPDGLVALGLDSEAFQFSTALGDRGDSQKFNGYPLYTYTLYSIRYISLR